MLAAVGVYLATADLGRHKNQLTPLISNALGRELRIEGNLSLHLGRTISLRAEEVSVANAAWADGPHLLHAAGVEADVDLWSLIRGPVRVESLTLQGAVIRLQKDEDGRRNWLQPKGAVLKEDSDAVPQALPRVAAFKASNVRILLAAPELSGVSETLVDTADYAVDGDLVVANVGGEINGHPAKLETRIAPEEHSTTAGAFTIDANVQLGEVTLSAGVLLADTKTLAVSAAELELNGPDIDYVFSVLKLPRITSGPLAIKASLKPDPQRSGFDAEGRVGEYNFAVHGWLEDLRGTGGFDVSLQLSGPSLATLGRPFDIEDLPAVPFHVDGKVRSQADGITFDDTRVIVGEDGARVDGSLRWFADGSQKLHVGADYLGMSSRMLVTMPAGWRAGKIDFDFDVEGDDAGEPADRLGAGHLAGQAFALSGKGTYRGRTIQLSEARARVGEQTLELTGRAEVIPGAPDLELRFDARNIDLSPLLAGSDLLDSGARTLTGTGRLRVSEGRLDADELSLRSGDALLEGRVSLPLADSGKTGEFALHLTAPGVENFVPGLAGAALGRQPVDLRGNGNWTPGGWQLGEILWRIPGRGDLRGRVFFASSPSPSISAKLSSASLDLRPVDNNNATPAPSVAGDSVIPDQDIIFPDLPDLDIDLQVEIDSLQSPVTAGASLVLEARLANNQLIVDRLETRGTRGQIRASLTVAADSTSAVEAQLALHGQELYIAAPEEPPAALYARPQFDLEVALQAKGAHLREMAETLNGRIRIQAEEGTITRRGGALVTLVMDDFLTRTLETVNPLVKGRDEVQLNCFVVLAEIEEGRVRGDPLVALQTTEVNLVTRGEIDLGSETLKLDIITKPRRGLGISLGDVINPFTRIGGTLAAPRLVADPKSAVFETGAGILTGGAWVVAKKFRDRFFAGNPCAKALEATNKANQQQ